MADKFELRKETDQIARLVDERLQKSKYVMVHVGTGGGKTYIGIHAIARIVPDAHIIIFAPKKKIDERDWEKSIDSYNEVMKTDLVYNTYNYELLVHDQHHKEIYKTINQYNLKSCKKKRHVIILLDEAHRVKNPTSKTCKRVASLSKNKACLRIIGLTATPVSNSYMDAIGYFVLADFYTSKTAFIRRHVKHFDHFGAPVVKDGRGNIDRNCFIDPDLLDRLLQHITVTVDVDYLKPKRIGLTQEFTLSPEKMKAYHQIKKDYKNGLYDSVQKAIQEMREFVARNADDKNAFVSQMLQSPVVTRPVLLFYSYKAELESIKPYLIEHHPDFDIIEINGSSKNTEEDLREPKNPRTIFLIQYRSGSEGLDAKWSNVSIFYAPTNMYQAMKQAMGRNVRAGQKTGTVYQMKLVTKGTIEEHTWDILSKKADFTQKLMMKFLEDVDDDIDPYLSMINNQPTTIERYSTPKRTSSYEATQIKQVTQTTQQPIENMASANPFE